MLVCQSVSAGRCSIGFQCVRNLVSGTYDKVGRKIGLSSQEHGPQTSWVEVHLIVFHVVRTSSDGAIVSVCLPPPIFDSVRHFPRWFVVFAFCQVEAEAHQTEQLLQVYSGLLCQSPRVLKHAVSGRAILVADCEAEISCYRAPTGMVANASGENGSP